MGPGEDAEVVCIFVSQIVDMVAPALASCFSVALLEMLWKAVVLNFCFNEDNAMLKFGDGKLFIINCIKFNFWKI